ncbi:CRISPR-associated endonuclease Cas2 [Aporhodopirellula aestuarii]|uniref:CRISPR-associated endoribonuclease Cas2 n=1 Tax=Aporhodopirellula aestuarii TaxID=2950107 RepID=A0ABT0UAV3_9BACT|nr:CRISPR-associated endonuclease Cas2 [Aporhodopirellula aestuarii]MCM2373994.1 CRISPR-associated endonuclease Cas2 [Aporhodopirellula aestuarii]
MNFLVCYDIADPKRLQRIAKELEKVGRRVQKSVFCFTGTRRELDEVMNALTQIIDPTIDRIQAWPIRTSTRSARVDVGAALPDRGVVLIVTPDDWRLIEALENPAENDEPLILDD